MPLDSENALLSINSINNRITITKEITNYAYLREMKNQWFGGKPGPLKSGPAGDY